MPQRHHKIYGQAKSFIFNARLYQPQNPLASEKFLHRTEPLYFEDISQVPEHPYREKILQWGWKSVLGMALVVQGQPVGFLEVYSLGEVRHFTSWHCKLFKTFAAQASIAIENVTSRNKLQQLNKLIEEMADIREVDDLLRLLLEGGHTLVGCAKGWVSQFDYKTGKRWIVDYKGPRPDTLGLKLGQGITGKALQEERPQRADDVHSSQWRKIYYEQWADTQSELAVPIIVGNAEVHKGKQVALGSKPIGVLNIESPTIGAFSQADEDLLWSLACQAALAINRIEFDRKLARLTEFQKDILTEKNWEDIFRLTAQDITDTLDFEYVHIALVDQERNCIKTERVIGIPDHELAEFKKNVVFTLDDQSMLAKVVQSGELEVPPVEDERLNVQEPNRFHQRNYLCVYVPMASQKDNRVIGVVEVGHLQTPWKYIYERDVQLLRGFIDYAVRALEHGERDLLGKIKHEFTAPITGIRNNASFLKRRFTELPENFIQTKLEDVLVDCEILLRQVGKLQYVLGRSAPASDKKRTLVVRDIIVKTINQLQPLAREIRV